ncbi:MAG: hypothetical protein R3B90_05645 [Planctomycetaceae bacterium]
MSSTDSNRDLKSPGGSSDGAERVSAPSLGDAAKVTDPPPASAVPAVTTSPTDDFGRLAGRIARRTTDLIVIAFFVGAAVIVTQRLVGWWKTDPASVSVAVESAFAAEALAPWGAGAGGAEVEFGSAPFRLRQSATTGSLKDALARLRSLCIADGTRQPRPELPSVTPEERRLVVRLTELPPVEGPLDGGVTVHELPGPLPMVFVLGPDPSSGLERVPPAEGRIFSWGLALPLESQVWSLLVVTPTVRSDLGVSEVAAIVPANATLGMSIRDEVGGSLATFSGNAEPFECAPSLTDML